MILVGVFLFGLIAPFVFIYGGLAFLLFIPFLALFQWGLPYWQRLPREQRRHIRKTLIWTTSIVLWASIILATINPS